ncbi:MAG: D-sedoheptulose 7-phosphate isomerase [Candidatus Gastranaerophilales bacterium]|nr:D-sedoheptulose 7-phosphate isomerase [Candidatus Gastranaerophilales bacterium]
MEVKKIESFEQTILSRFDETITVLTAMKNNITSIEEAAILITNCFKAGNKLLICGNGGSAADAQHIAAEFVGKFYRIDRPALPAIALNVNTSIITAIANDFGYDGIFTRQVEALGQKGDVFVGISTSGNSKNIIEAAKMAIQKGMYFVALTGQNECKLDKIAQIAIKVPSLNTPIIQNAHISTCHTICELVESQF